MRISTVKYLDSTLFKSTLTKRFGVRSSLNVKKQISNENA